MIQRTLELQIFTTTKGNAWSTGEEGKAWSQAQKAVEAALKGIPRSSGDFKFNLDGPKLAQQVEAVHRLVKIEKLARITRAALEEESLGGGPDGAAEWYQLEPRIELHDQGATPEALPLINAGQVRAGVHAVTIMGLPPVVSDAVKQLFEKKKFKSLEYFTLPDKGKRKAMPWHLPIALNPIGRGLDHDFFDPAKLKQGAKNASNWMTDDPHWRTGVVRLDADYFKPDITRTGTFSPEAKQLLSLIPAKMLRVSGIRRYVRRFLPRGVDFAFSWTWPDSSPERGHLVSSREWCVSRRAMEALVDAKLVGAKEFKPIEIVDDPPAGVKVLDKPGDTGPGPLFSDGEWRKRIEAHEKSLRTQAATTTTTPKRKAAPRANEVLNLLRKTRERTEDGFRKPATPTAIAQAEKKLGAPLPEFWRQVLLVSDGFELPGSDALSDAAVSFDSTKELRSPLQKQMRALYTEISGKKSAGLVYLGNTIYGDLVMLRAGTTDRRPDAPVMLVSHETGQEMSNWPSTAALLHDLLSS
jgi:hypothetical protein